MIKNFCRSTSKRALFLTACLSVSLILCLAMAACGKRGNPVPNDPSKTFSWKEATATMAGKCIAFAGTLEGAYGNLDAIRMEISPVGDGEDCPGCPFVPRETHMFSPLDAGFNSRDGSLGFSYCPSRGDVWQWRLIGISVYSSLPHAVSNIGTVVDTRSRRANDQN